MSNAGFQTAPILGNILNKFHKNHSQIEVECTLMSWSKAWQRIIGIIKRGSNSETLPDIVQIGSTWQGTLSSLGGLADLSQFADTNILNDFIPPLLSNCYGYNSRKIYAIPWFSDVRVLYYRTDVMKQLGVQVNDFNHWQGFKQVLGLVKRRLKGQIDPMSLSGQSENILIHDLLPWIWGSHAELVDWVTKKSHLREENTRRALHFYFSLINDAYMPLLGRDRMTVGNFFSGQSAFQVSGTWPVDSVFNPKSSDYNPKVAKNFGLALIPTNSPRTPYITFTGGSHLAILASSKHVEESWSLIKFLTKKENQEEHARKIGFLPARESSFHTSFFKEGWEEHQHIFEQAIKTSRTFPSLPVMGTIEQLIKYFTGDLLESVRMGRYSKEQLNHHCLRTSIEIDYILSLYA